MLRREPENINEEDAAFVEAIVQRDKRQFEILYKKYYQQLFALAYRYVKQQEVAEEIVHDVFITIWNKGEQLNIQYTIKSYLFRSIVNTSLNYLKKEKMNTEKKMVYMSAQNSLVADESGDESEQVLLIGLEEALSMLPAKCKEVMYLSRFGKMKQAEIAAQLDISVKTVKNHLTYGFHKIREHLNKRKHIITSLIVLLTCAAIMQTFSNLLMF